MYVPQLATSCVLVVLLSKQDESDNGRVMACRWLCCQRGHRGRVCVQLMALMPCPAPCRRSFLVCVQLMALMPCLRLAAGRFCVCAADGAYAMPCALPQVVFVSVQLMALMPCPAPCRRPCADCPKSRGCVTLLIRRADAVLGHYEYAPAAVKSRSWWQLLPCLRAKFALVLLVYS
jgi:hypothetical protein